MVPDEVEIARLRAVQADLRARLDRVDERLDEIARRIEEAKAASRPAVEAAGGLTPPPLPLPEVVEEISPYASEPVPVIAPPADEHVEDPLPEIAAEPVAASGESLEMRVGRVWLVRIGIVVLLTGLVLLGNFAWREMIVRLGPFGKLALIYLAGLGLTGFGFFLARAKEHVRGYGRIVAGGGLATLYYATYAAHFVEPLRVIESPFVGGALLMALAGGILWLADRTRSEVLATATTVLGFYTAAINPVAGFSVFSNLILAAMALVLLVRRRWVAVSFLSLFGCYAAFVFWQARHGSALSVWQALAFPASYWIVFAVAAAFARAGRFGPGSGSVFITLNNGGFFGTAALVLLPDHSDRIWLLSLWFGVLLLALSAWESRRRERDGGIEATYLWQGLGLVFLAILLKVAGYQSALLFAAQVAGFVRLSRSRHGVIFQIFAGIAAVLAASQAVWNLACSGSHAGLVAVVVSVVLTVAAWSLKRQRDGLAAPALWWRPMFLVALAALPAIGAIHQAFPGPVGILLFCAVAILLTVGFVVHRLPEVVLASQAFILSGVARWLFGPQDIEASVPVFLALGATVIVQLFWWRNQKEWATAWRWPALVFHSVLLALVTGLWLGARFASPQLAVTLIAGSLLLGLLGWRGKLKPMVLSSDLLTWAALIGVIRMLDSGAPWAWSLAALALACGKVILTDLASGDFPDAAGQAVRFYGNFVRAAVFMLSTAWVFAEVPRAWQFTVLNAGGFGFLLAFLLSSRGAHAAYAIFWGALGLGIFCLRQLDGTPVAVPDFAALALLLVAQRALRIRKIAVPEWGHALLAIAAIGGIWILGGRWMSATHSGFLLTLAWSLYAFVVLATGFILRERIFRFLALLVLGASVLRVFLHDVWQLETGFRILSFLVLGIVLLVLGFFYNRFADQLKKWL